LHKGESILYRNEVSPTLCRFGSLVAEWPDTSAASTGMVVRVDDHETPDARHRHVDFHALYVVRRGRGIHIVDDVAYGVARGDVYAMAAGAVHAYSQHEDLCLDALYFRPDAITESEWESLAQTPGFSSAFAGEGGGGKWRHLGPGAYGAVRTQFEELRREWGRNDASGKLLARALLLRLLVTIARDPEVISRPRRTSSNAAVAEAVRLLDERHGRPLRIAEVAREVGLCPDHLTVAFAATMGRTPRDYLRHVRVERAKTLLERSSESVGDIALATGFSDAPHFARTFRAQVGMTPGAYRLRLRQKE
jgi:AraC family L-rhamnose operon transcriptional activator RhaR